MKFYLTIVALLAMAGAVQPRSSQKRDRVSNLNSSVNEKIAVRFFYDPPGDYFHKPLIFRVAEDGSPKINTATVHEEGRIAYITISEMRTLVNGLAHANLVWRVSQKVEALRPFKELPLSDDMEILVVFSDGTAKAKLSPQVICTILKQLDTALTTPRALWEFQLLRLDDGCEVPGFKPEAYPDHF